MSRLSRTAIEKGMAMMEFVLVLPFIWIILSLSMNFALTLLERQRTLVALREVGFRQSTAASADGSDDVTSTADAVIADTLRPRRVTATFALREDEAGCRPDADNASAGVVRSVLSGMSRFNGSMSSTQVYSSSARGQQLTGRLLRQPSYSGCFAVDAYTWTYRETGGYGGFIKRLVGF
jgi:hypothetical protein